MSCLQVTLVFGLEIKGKTRWVVTISVTPWPGRVGPCNTPYRFRGVTVLQ